MSVLNLSLAQQATLKSFEYDLNKITVENITDDKLSDLKETILSLYCQLKIKDNVLTALLKKVDLDVDLFS